MRDPSTAAGCRRCDRSPVPLDPRSMPWRGYSAAAWALDAGREPPAVPLPPQWEVPRIPEEGTGHFRLPGPDHSRHHGRAGGTGPGRQGGGWG